MIDDPIGCTWCGARTQESVYFLRYLDLKFNSGDYAKCRDPQAPFMVYFNRYSRSLGLSTYLWIFNELDVAYRR